MFNWDGVMSKVKRCAFWVVGGLLYAAVAAALR